MSNLIHTREEELMEEFSLFDDWMDKYQYIIELGQNLPEMSETDKNEDNRVHGCQSQVWLTADLDGDKVVYEADSDAIITKGLVGMLTRVLSGNTPQEILQAELKFVDQAGIREHLSPTRSNGLNSMIKKMKMYALAFHQKLNA
ncbi:SufE family protein [Pontibacter sp. G13]|uniref:SufE family protein n=1 Tax=Pontibacter sp. G13 TaxID=3074898 RepID=UPI00288A8D38|nr:SufE family protein [Pontibacter sp. G13]WNJ19418.1 SufE family protein [Pontibacter sp. G13]